MTWSDLGCGSDVPWASVEAGMFSSAPWCVALPGRISAPCQLCECFPCLQKDVHILPGLALLLAGLGDPRGISVFTSSYVPCSGHTSYKAGHAHRLLAISPHDIHHS